MTDKQSKSKKKTARKENCITPNCGNEQVSRGVCMACYTSHRRAVEAKETTWEQLEAAGLVLPVGAKVKSPAIEARKSAGLVVEDHPAK
jgi:hypothetical protein